MSELDLTTPLGVTLALLPEIAVTVAAVVVLLAGAWLSLGGIVAGLAALGALAVSGAAPAGAPHMVALDGFRLASLLLILVASGAAILLSLDYLEREGLIAPEYYALLMMATAGMMFLAGAEDLMVLFLGLEVMSVPVYVLAAFDRRNVFSAEAGLKYFLVGALASAFLLYGIALLYGATGSMSLTVIAERLAVTGGSPMAALGAGLLLVGIGFKVASVPFHMWAPDVYDGAPTPVTAFMASGVKAAAFLALVRVVMVGLPELNPVWQPVVGALAFGSMAVGNLVALAQRSLKRMLAYSSIAHAGYLLAAIWPASRAGAAATLLYLTGYVLTTLATFGILAVLGRGGEREVTLESLSGLSRRRPWLAFALAVCMFSLLGFPGTFGFIGKYAILQALVAEHHRFLAVVVVLASLVSAGYYLPVVRALYMRDPASDDAHAGAALPGPARVAVAVGVAAILLFGVWPHLLTEGSAASAQAFAGNSLDRLLEQLR
jgi:NADH-quinone oxidoreductase subunit N